MKTAWMGLSSFGSSGEVLLQNFEVTGNSYGPYPKKIVARPNGVLAYTSVSV